jgi:hypothetical protein
MPELQREGENIIANKRVNLTAGICGCASRGWFSGGGRLPLAFATLRVANAELSSRSNAWSRRCALRTSHSSERHFACMKACGFRRLVPSLNSALCLKPFASGGDLMEAKFWKIAASLGIPGFALAVFYKLYDKFDWPLASIEPDRMFILVVIFMVIIAAIVIIALIIYRPKATGEQIVHKYDRLKEGLSSPEQNVALIQEIANSTDPNKEKYLQEFMDFKNISFLELAASKLALEEMRKSKKVSGLFESAKRKERENLSNIAGATGPMSHNI